MEPIKLSKLQKILDRVSIDEEGLTNDMEEVVLFLWHFGIIPKDRFHNDIEDSEPANG